MDRTLSSSTSRRQRWYGAKSRTVIHADVLDSVVVRSVEPELTLDLVELTYDTGAHDIYQLFLGRALETELARELVSAMRSTRMLQGTEGVSTSTPRPTSPRSARTSATGAARLLRAVEQLRRLRRRAHPQGLPPARAGDQPGARGLALPHRARLPERARTRGLVRVLGRPADRDARLLQEFVAGAVDGWELALDEIADAPERFLDRLDRLGEVTAQHAQRARLRPERSRVLSRGAEHGVARAARPRRSTRRSCASSSRCPRTTSTSRRSPATGKRCASSSPPQPCRLDRPRDPHTRRLSPRPDAWCRRRLGHPRLRGRARTDAHRAAAQAVAAAGRRGDAPLVRVRRDAPPSSLRDATCPRTGRSTRANGSSTATSRRRRDAPAPRRGGDRAAPRDVRAREGGLRAPLRARQSSRLGRRPRRRYRAAA